MERNDVIGKAYSDHYDVLYKAAYARLKDHHNAEDAVQEAFTKALQYFHTFNPEKAGAGAWINRILQNVCNKITQVERNKGVSMEFDEELAEGVYMTHEGDQLLDKAVEHINKERDANVRAMLTLYFVDRAKPREIEDIVGRSAQHVSNTVNLFKNRMRDIYA
jgi:RNA polymerase sigma factor (sigma-70 family)